MFRGGTVEFVAALICDPFVRYVPAEGPADPPMTDTFEAPVMKMAAVDVMFRSVTNADPGFTDHPGVVMLRNSTWDAVILRPASVTAPNGWKMTSGPAVFVVSGDKDCTG